MKPEELYSGDLVQVRSPSEILTTLGESGALGGLPFMPEMVVYCGRRLTVGHRVDKNCGTVKYTGSRRISNAMLLEDLRCDGSGHDGCQAACRIFWTEAYLRKVTPDAPPSEAPALFERASRDTHSRADDGGKVKTRYRCRNTGIPQYSGSLSVWDPRPCVREYAPGTVSLFHFVQVTSKLSRALRSLSHCASLDTSQRSTFLAPQSQEIKSTRGARAREIEGGNCEDADSGRKEQRNVVQ